MLHKSVLTTARIDSGPLITKRALSHRLISNRIYYDDRGLGQQLLHLSFLLGIVGFHLCYILKGWLNKRLLGIILLFLRATSSHGLDHELKVVD